MTKVCLAQEESLDGRRCLWVTWDFGFKFLHITFQAVDIRL